MKLATHIDYEKLYREAEMVALLAHRGQTYDIFPYEKHLRDVVAILEEYGFSGAIKIAGWLHDTYEDTTLTYSKIKNAFGKEIAEIVYAVTDELGRNRVERKSKTLPKIKAFGEKAIVVKLADRIANVENGIRMGNIESSEMYSKEYSKFREELYEPDTMAEPLWHRLDAVMLSLQK